MPAWDDRLSLSLTGATRTANTIRRRGLNSAGVVTSTVWKPSVRAMAVGLGLGGLGVAAGSALRWAHRRTSDIPLSSLHGGRRIDPMWPARNGVRGDRVPGEMDSLEDYARSDFDPDAVHPDVRALYEQTATFEMTISATWHFPYSLGARLASRWTDRIEQLNLPGPGGDSKRVSSDLFALAESAASADPRDEPRLWIRRDADTGAGVFVAIYASYVEDDERFVNIAVPLPATSLATVLRIQHYGEGVVLTTDCPPGGLYLHTSLGTFRLPASQAFRVSPAQESTEPAHDGGRNVADVLADQRISFLGLPLVTVRYRATRRSNT